jgi:hypothetical protein
VIFNRHEMTLDQAENPWDSPAEIALSWPEISIVIPTLNRANFLKSNLGSLQQQTFQKWETIVVDDCSVDDTAFQVEQFSEQDPRIRYVKRSSSQSGAPVCRNLGTQVARGKYIIYLDSDDYLASHALEQRYAFMEANPDLDYGIFPTLLFAQTPGDLRQIWNIYKDTDDLNRHLSGDFPWLTASPIWRKSALETLGGWDETLPSWQDFDLHVRALIKGLAYRWSDRPDNYWRKPHGVTIGQGQSLMHHMHAHDRLIKRIHQDLQETNLFTPERQRLIAGQYFRLMDHWARQEYRDEAAAIWQTCHQNGLISDTVYGQGQLYIDIWCQKRLPWQVRRLALRLARDYFRLVWEPGVCWQISPTWSKGLPSDFPLPL